MGWRYINPGYVHLLDKDAQTMAEQYTGFEYSKTGIGFYNISSFSYGNRNIILPNLQEGDEFWAKFDFFFPRETTVIRVAVPGTYQRGIYISFYSSSKIWLDLKYGDTGITIASANSLTAAESEIGLKINKMNTALIHVKYGSTENAHLDICLNGKEFSITPSREWTYSENESKGAIVYSNNSSAPISNIIISNEEINLKEQVITLPVSTTETAMTLQSDTYIADGVGQTLLQSVNVSSLIDEYGGDSKVTGIALFGNPAYRTGEQLSSLTAISKSGGVITEHGKSNLSYSEAVIWQGFSTASDMTISDLQNMYFGWKAGE